LIVNPVDSSLIDSNLVIAGLDPAIHPPAQEPAAKDAQRWNSEAPMRWAPAGQARG
jgi:hypothetical protein